MQSLRVRLVFICIDGHGKVAWTHWKKVKWQRMYFMCNLCEASDSWPLGSRPLHTYIAVACYLRSLPPPTSLDKVVYQKFKYHRITALLKIKSGVPASGRVASTASPPLASSSHPTHHSSRNFYTFAWDVIPLGQPTNFYSCFQYPPINFLCEIFLNWFLSPSPSFSSHTTLQKS